MRDTQLMQMALSLVDPWVVEDCSFDVSEKRLDIRINFERGGIFACPACGEAGCKAYDTQEKTWRHLDFFQHETYLHAFVPRVSCRKCGIKTADVPWARPGSHFTLLFEALLMAMCKRMPVKGVAEIVKEHDTRIWRKIRGSHLVSCNENGVRLAPLHCKIGTATYLHCLSALNPPAGVSRLTLRIAGTTIRGEDAPPTARRGFPPHTHIRGRMPILRLDKVCSTSSHSRQDAAPTARRLLCLFPSSPLFPRCGSPVIEVPDTPYFPVGSSLPDSTYWRSIFLTLPVRRRMARRFGRVMKPSAVSPKVQTS